MEFPEGLRAVMYPPGADLAACSHGDFVGAEVVLRAGPPADHRLVSVRDGVIPAEVGGLLADPLEFYAGVAARLRVLDGDGNVWDTGRQTGYPEEYLESELELERLMPELLDPAILMIAARHEIASGGAYGYRWWALRESYADDPVTLRAFVEDLPRGELECDPRVSSQIRIAQKLSAALGSDRSLTVCLM